MTQERAEIRLRGLPRTANRSGQPQARGAAPALRPSPEAAETRSGHGEPSTAPVSAAHSPVVKDHVSNNGAQRPARGGGARCPHAARQPAPVLRPARACASCLPARVVPATEARLAHPTARAACQTAVAVLLVRAAHPCACRGALPERWPARQRPAPRPPPGPPASASAVRPRASPTRSQPERSGGPGLDTGALQYDIASLARREPGKQRDSSRPSSSALGSGPTPAGKDAQG